MKKMVIIILLFLLTSCTATYHLEIKDDKFKENVSINIPNSDTGSLEYFQDNKFYAIMDGVSNFKKYHYSQKKNVDQTNVNFSYNYSVREFKKDTILKTCFSAYSILNSGKYYTLSTTEGLVCATEEDTILLDKLDVVIKTNHMVRDSNADEVDDYIYIWHFDKKNYKNKSVYLKIYKDKYVWNYENEFYKKIALYTFIMCVIIIFVLWWLFKFLKYKKNANKI